MKKRFMGLLLCTMMTASLLTGCGGGTDTGSTTDGSASQTGGQTAAVSELKGPGNVELSFLGQSLDFDPNADVMAGVIEEKTGYKVNYSMLPSDSPDEKLIADVAGGVKYDILKVTQDQFEKLYSKGALMPLKSLLETYGQDILNGLEDKEMWTPFSDESGEIYGIPFVNEYPKQVEYITCRKDLMREAGITEVPETLDEFYQDLGHLRIIMEINILFSLLPAVGMKAVKRLQQRLVSTMTGW